MGLAARRSNAAMPADRFPGTARRDRPASRGNGAEPPDAAAFLLALGARLRTLRTRCGMTRRGLAQLSGVSERYIAQMEGGRGNGSILLLRGLAAALEVPLAAVLGGETSAAHIALERIVARLSPPQAAQAARLIVEHFHGPEGGDRTAERVALIGLRGAGKSSLGRLFAERRGVRFVELDREIEREAGMGLAEIFELHGAPGYRRLERAVLERVLAAGEAAVIAAGGSIVTEPETYELLLAHCRTVWVRAAPEEHMQRVVNQGDLRPMKGHDRAMADLRAILAGREALYARADLTLDTSGQKVERSLDELVRLLG
jgi:XRE family aerobic/anaerobic benzoate catabolism transcriptional regulator